MLPARFTDVKLLPSPGRALVTSKRLENPGSAPGPNAARTIVVPAAARGPATARQSAARRPAKRWQAVVPTLTARGRAPGRAPPGSWLSARPAGGATSVLPGRG